VNTRPATPEDSDFIYQVKVDALKDFITQTWGWDDDFQWNFHRKNFRPEITQVIKDGNTDAGFLIVEESDNEIRISEINLLTNHQGKGIGSQIVRELQATARAKGKWVELQTLKVNPARRLYERLGFRVYSETETHFKMNCGVLIRARISTPPYAPESAFRDALSSFFAANIGALKAKDAMAAEEIDAAERQLGFRIPRPLRDFYRVSGNSPFHQVFDRMLAPSKIEVQDDMAIFCEENQCVVYYAFKIADADRDDPEVWQLNPHENKWYFDCKRMTSFLLKMSCWQAVCGGVSASAKGSISMAQFEELESTYERIDFGGADHEYALQAFHKNGVIVCAFPDDYRCQVFCGSNSRSTVKRIASSLHLDML